MTKARETFGTNPVDFIHDFKWKDAPESAQQDAIRALIDSLGVSVSASQTQLSHIIRNHAASQFGGNRARLWQDGRTVSAAGAALANGMTIDALDAHDGYKPAKGHVGCGVIPATIAFAETEGVTDPTVLLECIVVGYEIGSRAAVALHRSACDYHTSGAWVCLAVAAVGARLMELDADKTREALGIAEYHGPRSQMMRCIDHPTMVKDGSGWGAMAGVSAAYLARDGFTGAPALTIEDENLCDVWRDLGQHWTICEQYIKLYPVCRWAQPAMEAAMAVMAKHNLTSGDVAEISVATFFEATQLAVIPKTTEQAQYSLPFSVAAAVVRGDVGFEEVSHSGLNDPEILDLASRIELREEAAFNAEFPQKRLATVTIRTKAGESLQSHVTEAKGDPEERLGSNAIKDKFFRLVEPVVGEANSLQLYNCIQGLSDGSNNHTLFELLAGSSK